MKTADLIKKKEEEKNNPPQETTTSTMPTAPKPAEGMNMAEARMAGNGVSEMETTTPVTQTTNTTTNPVSLYEVGKQAGNISQAENTLAGKSPITTPEYEKFRNEVIGAQQFGVETEEQKKKRERADFIKQGLTGLTEGLSSLANLYYTTKWAPNQKMVSQMPELQKQLYRERLERDKKLENFRAWQREKANKAEEREYNLNLFNLKQDAANKAAEKKAKLEAQAAEIKYLRDLGLIDAKKAADLEKQKGKAALDKELETIKQKNRVLLKKTTTASDDKVLDSMTDKEGNTYTRNTRLTDSEKAQLATLLSSEELEGFTTRTYDVDGYETGKKIDYDGAAAWAINQGYVTGEMAKRMGFKTTAKTEGKYLLGKPNKPSKKLP